MKVLIFGTKDAASLAHFYLKHDSHYMVCGFIEDRKYIKKDIFESLPVVAFEDIENEFSKNDTCVFLPIYNNLLRETKCKEAESKGFSVISYVSSKASCFSNKIGKNCFIMENNTIQPYVEIGDNVILWSGNHVGHHSKICDNVFVSSHVVISGHCNIGSYSWLGVNACLRDSITLSEGSFITMGSVVTKDTEPYGKYKGNPASKVGIIDKGSL
jgi:sugar O-acyltransferase (sialic acid O-acetyltransferase NeuD family)